MKPEWRGWPRSLWGRLSLLFLGVLLAAQLLSATLHFRDRSMALMQAAGVDSAQRIAGIVQILDPLPAAQRRDVVTALDLPPLRLSLAEQATPLPDDDRESARSRLFHHLLHRQLGDERPILVTLHESAEPVVEGANDPAPTSANPMQAMMARHMALAGGRGWSLGLDPRFSFLVQIELDGGQWVRFAYLLPEQLAAWPWDLLWALLMLTGVVIAVSFLAVRWLTRPLSELATAADELGKDIQHPPLAETGPTEVRRAAHAFNTMQQRLSRFVEERTRILAAVSHDLKTPITRMRLRVEGITDPQLRARFERDLGDMQTLVQSSLDFMRGIAIQERSQPLDIDALLESLRDDAEDMGHTVRIHGAADRPYPGKPLALKRGLNNLIENAIRYGREADIEVHDSVRNLHIVIRDHGPGLPEAELERLFEPFRRLESSRNPQTGGTGLGLGIARNIARAHGGELTLTNHPEGGLAAHLLLPR